MKEYLDFIRDLADLIENVGFDEALNQVESKTTDAHTAWRDDELDTLPRYYKNVTYRIKPATTQHPGGEMPQHVSHEDFKSAEDNPKYHTPFSFGITTKDWLTFTYGDDAHKMAFDTAEKARAAEKVMRGF